MEGCQKTFVTRGGINVRYLEAGEGPAVLLVHGLSTSMVTDSSSTVVASSRTASGASFTSVTVMSTRMLSLAVDGSVAVTVTE